VAGAPTAVYIELMRHEGAQALRWHDRDVMFRERGSISAGRPSWLDAPPIAIAPASSNVIFDYEDAHGRGAETVTRDRSDTSNCFQTSRQLHPPPNSRSASLSSRTTCSGVCLRRDIYVLL
jgi:hypothetical protein